MTTPKTEAEKIEYDLDHVEKLAKEMIEKNPNGGMYHSPQFMLHLINLTKRAANPLPHPVRDKEFFKEIIRKWKFSWMNQRQNGEADFKNYHRRAFGIDSNMIYSLADRLVAAMEEEKK